VAEVPLLGTVAAGEPIEAIAEQEFIALPEEMLPPPARTTSSGCAATR